jgi:ABC-type transport system substrate-binding protein
VKLILNKSIVFILVCLLAVSCSDSQDKSDSEKIVHIPLSDQVASLDPANAYDTISASVLHQIYEPLYEYHYLKRPYTLQPLLAKSLPEVSENGTKYTIKVKEGISYHSDPSLSETPKRAVTAQDFINQIKRLAYIPTRSSGWWLFDSKILGLNEFRKKAKTLKDFQNIEVEGLKAPDDHTLIIKLTRPYPQLISVLAMSFTSPIPLETIKFYDNILNANTIGTGPFKLTEWTKMSSIKLDRYRDYRSSTYPTEGDRHAHVEGLLQDAGKSIPFVDGVEFHVIKEAQTRWLNFKSQKIDYLVIPKDNYGTAIDETGELTPELKKENIKLEVFPTLTYWWLSFNMTDPVVGGEKNIYIRQAIAHAIDQERYIRVFTNNIGQKANSIYPPGIPGYDPSAQLPYEYNLQKARDYLKKAGHPNGKDLPTLNYEVRGASATNRQQAQFVKNQLNKIGINVDIVTNTFPGFLEKARNGKLQFWQDGWALDYPDAENVLQLLYSKNHAPGPNATFFKNEKFDKLFEELKLLSDGDKKKEIMVELEKIIHKELPWIMQYYSRNYILMHGHLNNYRHSDLIYNTLKYLKLD